MTDIHLILFCLVDGETTTNAFPIKIPSSDNVYDLKKLIKAVKNNDFSNIDTEKLILWHVSIPNEDNDGLPILLETVPEKKKLGPVTYLSKVFPEELPEKTIHILVQRPPPVHAPIPAHTSTHLSVRPSDEPRRGTRLSG
ncbi:hypothetical protein BGZ81_009700 [Podila clonocystis]|nr:hypothetical protein BGZ81_009700 [Podila clonocystis]